ncbi:aminodeoxychorismate synthase component I [Leptospira gomenensis]|uniref:Aminodeoxychorismate synthase component I n=1 Tax=Leptospira gomenensis TaxID=2484974 RepID=A0A5F1Y765_9LEPT|nr:aminodeoxychorismate synthase component I [Leptospira gomenensis]TGK28090.1 aminodeoxychorismate synthase component I [Leptospira gomenensis]TGK37054.1 aminodeoxychorismate synthase component I [Leptospira gomenensis]TGK45690.1 aminodeoxychorismate synthase component I [Leptospira gomenensis]TGK59629.1 aminodeoxychorismate synthase component I [Leptospira gomenensis]
MRIEELQFSDQPFMMFEEGFHPYGKIIFRNPVDTIDAYKPEELNASLNKIDSYLKKGFHVAGFISYEAGTFFSGMNWKEYETVLPLLRLAVFENPEKIRDEGKDYLRNFGFYVTRRPEESEYFHNLDEIRKRLFEGEIYQINYTDRIDFDFEGDILSFYKVLSERQPVRFGSWIRTETADILSFSPELFFEKKNGILITKPMKGTYPRGKSPEEDGANRKLLQESEKERAENLMITDLMRNDLGKISKTGSVSVSELFSVETYKTIYQMTSTVRSELSESVGWSDIFRELLPGGSVTGAPKLRAMELIRTLEKPRGIYTGIIGIIEPNGNAAFSIAIRTLEIRNGKGSIGVGSGITWDSEPLREWSEIFEKAKFLTETRNGFTLFETILYKNGIFYFHKEHFERISNSAKTFEFPFSEKEWNRTLEELSKKIPKRKPYRVRIDLYPSGEFKTVLSELAPYPKKGNVTISRLKTDSSSIFRRHKTGLRETYDREGKKSREAGFLDVIFVNEKNEIVEGSIANVFVKIGKEYYTPPIESGVLPGVYRNRLLKRKGFREKKISVSEMKNSESVFLCNSLRGILRVEKTIDST